MDYFTPSGKGMIAFNEPIILPDELNANSSVSDYFDVFIRDNDSGEKVQDVLGAFNFENIYSQYWYMNFTFLNETYFENFNCSMVMIFLQDSFASFNDQTEYPLDSREVSYEIPVQGEFYF